MVERACYRGAIIGDGCGLCLLQASYTQSQFTCSFIHLKFPNFLFFLVCRLMHPQLQEEQAACRVSRLLKRDLLPAFHRRGTIDW